MEAVADDGVELWWEVVGSGPPALLVPGRGDNADLYPSRFTDPLVAAGFAVVRYDPRDTGRSGDGGDSYGLDALATDALAVLDAAGAPAAHLVGFSMGGLVLSELIVRAPGRIRSLTFLSAASLDPDAGIGPDFFEMVGDNPVAAFAGGMHEPTDEDRSWVAEEIAVSERRAPPRPEAGWRHQEAAYRSPWPITTDIAGFDGSALVVHGREDRKLPLAHGRSYAATLANATLVELDDMGHIPRPGQWHEIAALVGAHLDAQGEDGPRV